MVTLLDTGRASETTAPREHEVLRRWISRAFLVSIAVYVVVIAYLVAESVRGASRWAPYGVNMPVFIALVIASEVFVTLTAVWIFKEDAGLWPASVSDGWRRIRSGGIISGFTQMAAGAWDIPIIDLRLRSRRAVYLGRLNRLAALAPLAYALTVSAGKGAPWGLRSSALVDVGITVAVWAFMEAVMVERVTRAPGAAHAATRRDARPAVRDIVSGRKESRYEIRPVTLEDVPRIEEIERLKWKDQAATRDMILSRLRAFPEGQRAAVHVTMLGGVEVRRSLVAWTTAMPARDEELRSFRSWDAVTAGGTIAGCDRDGDVLVGVNLTSVTEGATYILLGEILASVVEWGKTKLIGGGRLNSFVSFNEHRKLEGTRPFLPDEYARLREVRGYRLNERQTDNGLPPLSDDAYTAMVNDLRALSGEPPLTEDDAPDYVCSNLRGYLSIPGARMVDVVPGYFNDPSSADYGVVMEWPNPVPPVLRSLGPVRSWVAQRVRSEIRAEWERRKSRLRERTRTRIHEAASAAPAEVMVSAGSQLAPSAAARESVRSR